jgi:hypothetical protein
MTTRTKPATRNRPSIKLTLSSEALAALDELEPLGREPTVQERVEAEVERRNAKGLGMDRGAGIEIAAKLGIDGSQASRALKAIEEGDTSRRGGRSALVERLILAEYGRRKKKTA